MEKRSITGKDILRMDGLLPPTRRVPVCDAVTGNSEKKKEKKWSIGGILRRISAIRDYDSSSNDEEMVYCKKEPCTRAVPLKKTRDIVLRPVKKNWDQYSNKSSVASTADVSTVQSSNTSNFHRDSIYSRSSDGSLDGLGKKVRKNKVKARAEAKRDRICANSSSDEEVHKSWNSLPRVQNEDTAQSNQKLCSSNKKSRSARTERYIKRLSKDEGHGTLENLTDITNKRHSLDYMNDSQRTPENEKEDRFRPPVCPRRYSTQSSNHTFPVQRSSIDNLRTITDLPNGQTKSSIDLTKHPSNTYITDFNQNNQYGKPTKVSAKDENFLNEDRNNFCTDRSNHVRSFMPRDSYINIDNPTSGYQAITRTTCPPEPPPRDPRYRPTAYNCYSFPFNGRHQRAPKFSDVGDSGTRLINGISAHPSKISTSYDSNNEINWCGSYRGNPRRPMSLNEGSSQFYNMESCPNNRYYSLGKRVDDTSFRNMETLKCQMRNSQNIRLNSDFNHYALPSCKPKFSTSSAFDIRDTSPQPSQTSSLRVSHEPVERLHVNRPVERTSQKSSRNTSDQDFTCKTDRNNRSDSLKDSADEESQQRKRSSKNLEEALSELEAIYNSLRLGDEDLLDRAERRSMEEFSVRQGKSEDLRISTPPDSPDRTRDDMAYRRMHPKERPIPVKKIGPQSTLSNISYLMASPILSRKDLADDYLPTVNCQIRPDEPDITRDDVVYRSIHHANNTLKVVEPQPPFGIPLGPVTSATESDYLHTIPSKPDHPRSSYIPQCEPDIVTDDLAYRTLRKDANICKNVTESKTSTGRDQEATFGMKKKRAVRSLSANLYGLINHDRIHLQREPNLLEITEANVICPVSPVKLENCRRVMSDGELSDYDTRWRSHSSCKKSTDINGNHPASGINKRKLRVYVSPSSREQSSDTENGVSSEIVNSVGSDPVLVSELRNDEFWQSYIQSKSNNGVSDKKDTSANFTAYSQLCQDLVNLIKGPDDAESKPIKEEKTSVPILKQSTKINDPEVSSKDDEPSVLRIQSLGRHYSELDDAISPVKEEADDTEDIEQLTKSIIISETEGSQTAEDNTLDFYLRLADENVKLIAEAFSSVADHLHNSRQSQKIPLSSRRSETENDSATHDTSSRSSISYSQDDASNEQSRSSNSVERHETISTEDDSTFLNDKEKMKKDCVTASATTDAELDLRKAVHDLQLAAASLCQHEKEIEELEKQLKKNMSNNSVSTLNIENNKEDTEVELSKSCGDSLSSESGIQENKIDEDKEQIEEKKEVDVSTQMEMEMEKTEENDEGEKQECEFFDKPYETETFRPTGMCISYVTNLITIMLTTYPMFLLACFLALLLANIAAS